MNWLTLLVIFLWFAGVLLLLLGLSLSRIARRNDDKVNKALKELDSAETKEDKAVSNL
jgi:cytochrome c-type biogenesis protein CcmH/NrfF